MSKSRTPVLAAIAAVLRPTRVACDAPVPLPMPLPLPSPAPWCMLRKPGDGCVRGDRWRHWLGHAATAPAAAATPAVPATAARARCCPPSRATCVAAALQPLGCRSSPCAACHTTEALLALHGRSGGAAAVLRQQRQPQPQRPHHRWRRWWRHDQWRWQLWRYGAACGGERQGGGGDGSSASLLLGARLRSVNPVSAHKKCHSCVPISTASRD